MFPSQDLGTFPTLQFGTSNHIVFPRTEVGTFPSLELGTFRTKNLETLRILSLWEDSSCKEEKVEDFVFKLEKVVETKVAYFYTPSPKN